MSIQEAEEFAALHQMKYFETSAKKNQNITEAMNHIFEITLEKKIQNEIDSIE